MLGAMLMMGSFMVEFVKTRRTKPIGLALLAHLDLLAPSAPALVLAPAMACRYLARSSSSPSLPMSV